MHFGIFYGDDGGESWMRMVFSKASITKFVTVISPSSIKDEG